MKQIHFLLIGVATLLCTSFAGYSAEMAIGFVNFKTCIEKSKQGQQEKNGFDAMKKQMGESLQKTEKELEDLAKKLEDQDYMDGLSPTAEEELKQRFQTLNREFATYQNQYYQLLNQANMRMLQGLHVHVCSAAEKVREKNKLNFIINEDSTFAFAPTLNFTDDVIKEMDKRFELENGEKTASVDHEQQKR